MMQRQKQGENFETVTEAADAKHWNQGHFVTKFALVLMLFCPVYMHPIIQREISMFLE
jgi:hypothetical protein